jgi:hypothetical protein
MIYNYLLNNLFGGNKIAAAGATASIYGESGWNPFAVGTGGRGLIGWTPPSTISNAAFSGGMRTQLPAILDFVVNSGDSAVIAEMFRATSVLQAANEWGVGVERFGINDVHPAGVALASSFMAKGGPVKGFASGGLVDDLPPGQSAERTAFARVRSALNAAFAHPNAYVASHKKSLTGELGTLTKRQVGEQGAYALLEKRGLTKSNLSKFATQAREELATTGDKFLSTAEPGLTRNLAATLKALQVIAGEPAINTGPPVKLPPVKLPLVKLPPPKRPPVGGGGMHGGPLTRAQYAADLAQVHGLSLADIRKSPHLEHVWHLLHLQHLADIGGMAGGGMVFDRGGTLAPGANLVFNQTGKPEHLTPDSGGGGDVHVHFHNHGVIGSEQEVKRWLLESVRELARVKGGGSAERAFSRR